MKSSLLQLAENVAQAIRVYGPDRRDTPARPLKPPDNTRAPIHLLITDVVMPEMNGKTLRKRIEEYRPDIKTLFMSGHTSEVFMEGGSAWK